MAPAKAAIGRDHGRCRAPAYSYIDEVIELLAELDFAILTSPLAHPVTDHRKHRQNRHIWVARPRAFFVQPDSHKSQ